MSRNNRTARHFTCALGIISMLALATSSAMADEETDPSAPKLYTGVGAGVEIGGGVVGFTDNDMRDFTDVGGSWEVRGTIGTRKHLAAEAAYSGGAQSVDALGLDSGANLLSTGLEALARYNVLVTEWQPYIAVGVGWRRYDVTDADFNTSSVADDDNVFEIPMGLGIAYRYRGLIVDARGMFRVATGADLVAPTEGGSEPDLHNWTAKLNVGWEF